MKKTVPFFLFLLLFATQPVLAETSVNVNNSSSGSCNSHIKITTNGVTKEVNSTDCTDLSLSSDDSNPSSTSNPSASPTPKPTSSTSSRPSATPAPTLEPTESPSSSASASPSAQPIPNPNPDQQSWFDKVVDSISKIVGSIFGS